MRKNDLIELLQSIQGNPEIMFWNDLVGDVVPLAKGAGCLMTGRQLIKE